PRRASPRVRCGTDCEPSWILLGRTDIRVVGEGHRQLTTCRTHPAKTPRSQYSGDFDSLKRRAEIRARRPDHVRRLFVRFVWAVVAFVLATLLIGAGIAQRTIFMGPSAVQTEVSVDGPAPYLLIDGAVLRQHPGKQTMLIRGDGEIFAAYGRT